MMVFAFVGIQILASYILCFVHFVKLVMIGIKYSRSGMELELYGSMYNFFPVSSFVDGEIWYGMNIISVDLFINQHNIGLGEDFFQNQKALFTLLKIHLGTHLGKCH
jgi:hypothetical protein